MKKLIFLFMCATFFGQLSAQNPFKELGIKDSDYLTLSDGRYDEFHEYNDYERVGSAIIDMRTNKIVRFINRDSVIDEGMAELDMTTRFLTIDPMAEKYFQMSPYAYCLNNPIKFIDPDGKIVRDEKGNIVYSSSGQTATFTHPSGSSATLEIGYVYADNGTPIQVLNNSQGGDAGWDTNCHGTTFTDGKYWLNNDQVPSLVKGDGYKSQTVESAKEGDKIVYLGKGNETEHSMTITKTDGTAEGMKVYGQGGLEVENHTDNATEAWPSAKGAAILRKDTPDKVATNDEIKKLKENVPQN